MSRIVLKLAQAVGIVVLAFVALSLVLGVVQWIAVAAVLVAVPVAGVWLYLRASGRGAGTGRSAPSRRAARPDGAVATRRAELEARAVLDPAGRCGWCGSATRHQDRFGFPTTPLAHHREEIDAML
ncbi:hypothetical protein Ae168Ps1_0624c [Pseudonocardia sp. Ae168_Ps1]|uniref:hypothetical protein n=1 Tax=unclassified Pseudonocardia TaxID=2619320 RepID=UPI00094B03C9|nr:MULTISPECIES: hypothetical protein [unclassified Pseudonocardia]OLL72248.1 hypothetical protein Ae150APs1_0626c [Pseudonocardia sp. Ae150A_Ps1]OLL78218.1 hypothetical protein Ae168Ps1_0624c [Pseudonocardia sp. Ae168_Ps1]OLL87660.1 hypothetical protein Ae263Ps1_4715 [Pseudonocardia sp. Ae263_Ps1]OLL92313.1 hypothetical protein Ae356Ps1_2210c [Pseudonocardia sp. Ae356_Ps1]